MAQPAATAGCQHLCPAYNGDHPHRGGPAIAGSANCFINGRAALRAGDPLHCDNSGPDVAAGGSATVFVNNLPLCRAGDPSLHGGVITQGSATVSIG